MAGLVQGAHHINGKDKTYIFTVGMWKAVSDSSNIHYCIFTIFLGKAEKFYLKVILLPWEADGEDYLNQEKAKRNNEKWK